MSDINDNQTHVERLFDAESQLRSSAIAYAVAKNDETRSRLRAAAIAYADIANAINEDCGS